MRDHMPPLVLVHHDVRAGVLEQPQPAGVVSVQVSLHHVRKVFRPQSAIPQHRFETNLRRDRVEIQQLQPLRQPFIGPARGDAGFEEDQSGIGMLNHVGQCGALIHPVDHVTVEPFWLATVRGVEESRERDREVAQLQP